MAKKRTPPTLSDRPLDLSQTRDLVAIVSLGQSVYYVVTGLWGLLGINTFQKITGPKVDTWLVRTVSLLVIAIGAVLGMAGYRRNTQPEMPTLAISSAAGLAAIDVVYTAKGRIRPVYLLDALAEFALIAGWLITWPRAYRESGTR
jgi:uncharacterized membrane protein YoaK (UPF0700 family)